MNKIRMICATVLFCILFCHANFEILAEARAINNEIVATEASDSPAPVSAYSGDALWLVLDSYEINNGRLTAGSDSVITLKISNKNKKLDASNVMLTLSGDTDVIMPQTGFSNQVFVNSVPKDGTLDVEIPINVAEGKVGNYSLEMRLDYVYKFSSENAGAFSNTFKINLPVYLSAVITEDLQLSSNAGSLKLNYLNSGSKDIYNVTAHVSGDLSGTVNYYIGNVQAGSNGTIDIPVSFLSKGNKNIKLYYSYKNDKGMSIKSDEESFLVTVNNLDIANDESEAAENEQGISLSFVVIMLVCFISVVVSLWYGLFSKKRK